MPKTDRTKQQALALALKQAAAMRNAGRFVQCEEFCQVALKLDRNNFEVLYLLGVVTADQGRHEDAIRFIRRALRTKPDHAGAHCQLGLALAALKRFEEAITSYRRAIAIQPEDAIAHLHLAVALKAVNRRQEADSTFEKSLAVRRKALAQRPADFLARLHLATEFKELGDMSSALACCREALALAPDSASARGAMAMYQLPTAFGDGQDVAETRVAFERELSQLDDWLEAKRPIDGYAAFDNVRVFHLAYQEVNNLDLLCRYGDLCARTLRRWQEAQGLVMRSAACGEKIRVGIVLAKVGSDSVWNAIVKGWVEHLDQGRFEVHLFQLEPGHDEETRFAISRTIHVDLAGKSLRECVEGILASNVDVLIYPEIAMHPKPAVLASLRLAPIQAASWGHPETSGLPTIDYFLSAEDMEPVDAQKYYREQLVMLPRLGCCYQRPAVIPLAPDLARLGIASDRPLLICAGTPFKYAPEFDWVLVEIARRLEKCQLVFFIYERSFVTEKLRQRLEAVFARSGLVFRDYAVFIPWQQRPEYYGLLGRADVHLDTIGFSGFNTALQSIECGLPVATREGRFLRGRLASGILKRIGLTELVAATEEDYIALAVRLARDADYQLRIRRQIEQSRHALFGDGMTVRALENWLEEVARADSGCKLK